MGKTFRRRQKPNLSLLFSAIILATIPIAIYSLLTTKTLDTRQFAQESFSPCIINIPYVNTKTLATDKTYQVHVYTNLHNESIKNISIFNRRRSEVFSKQYTPSVKNISEVFAFSPTKTGQEELFGEIQTESNTYSCEMDKGQELIFVIEQNHAPVFLTDPYFSAKPPSSYLTTQETYEYTLEAVDKDLDYIEYHYSFTPRADWLHKTVLENGKDGKLKLKFSGTPDKDGSYLANVFIHDGYHRHISAQSWVISIGQESSDIPLRQEPRIPIIDSEFDNEIVLEQPQINKIYPNENSYTTNPKETISANLIASQGAKINQDSIIFKINDVDLTEEIEIVNISQSEVFLKYAPQDILETGEHNPYIYFEDSNGLSIEKEWFFSVEVDSAEKTFLGFPITTVMIFVIGTLLILFALSIPWIIYIAWKKDETEEYEELPILKPEGKTSFQDSFQKKKE